MNNANKRPPTDTLKIVKLGDAILRQKAVPVTAFGPELEEIVARMIVLLDEAQGVGLAAPQVGIGERFFIARIKNEAPIVFVNPSIIGMSTETVTSEEGCLSLSGVYADVARPEAVKVQAFDTRGRPFTLECSGILARIVQHENDHLDGILFYDHLSELKQKRLLERYEKIAKHK
ncbi:MAG: peptide deformylase [Spirochaetaceae bacterium]|jgi:peptide deformylase|nr:peptide deformylase [Spirochaetaceae bacterium]